MAFCKQAVSHDCWRQVVQKADEIGWDGEAEQSDIDHID